MFSIVVYRKLTEYFSTSFTEGFRESSVVTLVLLCHYCNLFNVLIFTSLSLVLLSIFSFGKALQSYDLILDWPNFFETFLKFFRSLAAFQRLCCLWHRLQFFCPAGLCNLRYYRKAGAKLGTFGLPCKFLSNYFCINFRQNVAITAQPPKPQPLTACKKIAQKSPLCSPVCIIMQKRRGWWGPEPGERGGEGRGG